MPRPRNINRCRLQVIAYYDNNGRYVRELTDYESAFDFFSLCVDSRLRGTLKFDKLQLVNPATHRLLCQYIDTRHIVKQEFLNEENYELI